MTIDKNIRVRQLLELRPAARELLTWYGVGLDSHALRMTLGQLCRAEGLDVDDALAEINDDYDDDDDDDDEEEDDDDLGDDGYVDDDDDFEDEDEDDYEDEDEF